MHILLQNTKQVKYKKILEFDLSGFSGILITFQFDVVDTRYYTLLWFLYTCVKKNCLSSHCLRLFKHVKEQCHGDQLYGGHLKKRENYSLQYHNI